jgi:hypothetical protein
MTLLMRLLILVLTHSRVSSPVCVDTGVLALVKRGERQYRVSFD